MSCPPLIVTVMLPQLQRPEMEASNEKLDMMMLDLEVGERRRKHLNFSARMNCEVLYL